MKLSKARLNDIARVCHEANRAYCITLNDHSQLPYDDCPKWQSDSSIASIEFIVNNPEVTSADIHDNWAKDKISAGWVYGDVKCSEAKTHPCLIPYNKLPLEQRIKDSIFISIVKSMLGELE